MAGKIQDADVKSSSEVTAISRLINDTKIYVSANGINKQLSTAITDGDIGGGASGINYITNGRALTDTTGWAVYADAAASRPVDGTGGSANVTFTRSTSSPLRGAADFLFTKDAVNRQGQGASYAFTIDAADQAKVLNISFDWAVGSGTFSGGSSSADSDLIVYVYDVTNAALIEPAPFKLDGAVIGVNYRFVGSFQSASNSTSYRVILHTATTSASAYTLQFDSFTVSPSVVTTGAYASDAVEYIPTFTGFGTVANVKVRSWRIGQYLFSEGSFTAGTTTATQARISLGFAGANGSVVSASTLATGSEMIGTWTCTAANQGGPILGSPGLTYINLGLETSASAGYAFMNGNSVTSANAVSFNFKIPIQGWGTSQVLSSETDTRVVAARYSSSAGIAVPSVTATLVDYATKHIDTHNAVTTGASWKFTAPISGIYQVSGAWKFVTSTYGGTSNFTQYLYKNAGLQNELGFVRTENGSGSIAPAGSGTTLIELKAGDYLDFRMFQDNGATENLEASGTGNFIDIVRISGPSQIAASESVAAVYRQDSGQTLTSVATIKYNLKDIDTHNAYNTATGQFTSPVSGLYELQFQLFSISATTQWTVEIRKNGVTVARQQVQPTWAANTTNNNNQSVAIGYYIFRLNAGDTMDVYLRNAVGTGSVYNSSIDNVLTIKKVGN